VPLGWNRSLLLGPAQKAPGTPSQGHWIPRGAPWQAGAGAPPHSPRSTASTSDIPFLPGRGLSLIGQRGGGGGAGKASFGAKGRGTRGWGWVWGAGRGVRQVEREGVGPRWASLGPDMKRSPSSPVTRLAEIRESAKAGTLSKPGVHQGSAQGTQKQGPGAGERKRVSREPRGPK